MEIPSEHAWNSPHQLAITQNLRDAVCDQMSDTIIETVHQEGKQLIAVRRQRAGVVLDGASEAQLGWPWRRWERRGAMGNWTGGVRFANSPSASYRKGVEGRVSA